MDETTKHLLCNEETKGLCFDDGDFINEPFGDRSSNQINSGRGNGVAESEPLIPLPCLSEESIGWMVEREKHHLPRKDYLIRLKNGNLDLSLRFKALDWMLKTCSYHEFGESCLYSAVNFLDRFLSVYSLPGGRMWAIHLIAVSCLSLSAKMNEVNVPSIVDLQVGEAKFLFEGRTIQRMEILVLNCLNWNMNVCTPFSFIDYFLIKATNWALISQGALIKRSIQIIMSTIKGIDFLEFRPSEIAAAVAVFVSQEIQAVDIDKALFGCIGVEKGRVAKCLGMVQELVSRTEASSASTTTTAAAAALTNTGSTASLDNGAVTSPMPCNMNGALDASALHAAAATTVSNSSVGIDVVSLRKPHSPDVVFGASTYTPTISATVSTGHSTVTPLVPHSPKEALDASTSTPAAIITTTVITPSVGNGVVLSVPHSLNVAFRASSHTATAAATTITTASMDNGMVMLSMPHSPNHVLDASASTTVATITTTCRTINVDNAAIMLPPVQRSPIGVLDAAFLSYKSGERCAEPCPSSSHTGPDSKRRKLDHMTPLSGGS